MSLTTLELADVSQGTRLRRTRVLKYLADYNTKLVLECGCGVGVYSKMLKNMADSLCSFDLNRNLVNIASSYVKGVKFFVCDVANIPFANNTFTAAIATDIIEHLRTPEAAIKNIYTVLKPGGVLIVTIPSQSWETVYKVVNMKKEDVGHYHLYDIRALKTLFEREGFLLVKFRKVQSFFSAFIDILISKLSIVLFGRNKVVHSEMTLEASNNKRLAAIYHVFNKAIYPLVVFFDWILPQCCKAEYLVVFKKP